MPNLSQLVIFGQRSALNLNWLLTGDGPMLRPYHVVTPEGQLLSVLEGHLRSLEGAEPHEALQVWGQLCILEDDETGRPGMFRAALEGVRPIYRRLLADYRDFDRAQTAMSNWTRAWMRGEQISTEAWKERLAELYEIVSAQVRKRGETIVVNGPEPLLLRAARPTAAPH